MRMLRLLEAVKVVVFDMDDTLYPTETGIKSQITSRIRQFIQTTVGCSEEEARAMARGWYASHGSALQGLMAFHNVLPGHFLHEVYSNINLDGLTQTPGLSSVLDWLDGKHIPKVILTNSPLFYAERVLGQIGVGGRFDRLVDIVEVGYQAKPCLYPYQYLLEAISTAGQDCLMFEDSLENLGSAKKLGLKTILLSPEAIKSPDLDGCINHFDIQTGA
jgi:putative hydrolase of the HAD superfamily